MSSIWFLGLISVVTITLGLCGSIMRMSLGSMSHLSSSMQSHLKMRALCEYTGAVFKKTYAHAQTYFEMYQDYEHTRVLVTLEKVASGLILCRILSSGRCMYHVLLCLD